MDSRPLFQITYEDHTNIEIRNVKPLSDLCIRPDENIIDLRLYQPRDS